MGTTQVFPMLNFDDRSPAAHTEYTLWVQTAYLDARTIHGCQSRDRTEWSTNETGQ